MGDIEELKDSTEAKGSAAESPPASSVAESHSTRTEPAVDGSVAYRIAALLAMLALAVGALGIWFFFYR